jgi:hypothetical protein
MRKSSGAFERDGFDDRLCRIANLLLHGRVFVERAAWLVA